MQKRKNCWDGIIMIKENKMFFVLKNLSISLSRVLVLFVTTIFRPKKHTLKVRKRFFKNLQESVKLLFKHLKRNFLDHLPYNFSSQKKTCEIENSFVCNWSSSFLLFCQCAVCMWWFLVGNEWNVATLSLLSKDPFQMAKLVRPTKSKAQLSSGEWSETDNRQSNKGWTAEAW